MILRLYDPQQGAITIDGVNLKDYQRQSLRRQIGLALQDSTLFGATIRENIAYGKPEATLAEIEMAALITSYFSFKLLSIKKANLCASRAVG